MAIIRCFILDFDGVLVESNQEKTLAFQDLFALYPEYRDAMLDYHLANYSHPRMAKFEYYVHELMGRPHDLETVRQMARQFSELVVRRVVACPDVPGAREFLAEFSGRVPLYVSSVTPQDELKALIHARGLAPHFVDIFGDPPCKKRDAIQTIIRREMVLPSQVVFIGDSPSDYYAARETGIEFVGRDSGVAFDETGVKLHPTLLEIAERVRARVKA